MVMILVFDTKVMGSIPFIPLICKIINDDIKKILYIKNKI